MRTYTVVYRNGKTRKVTGVRKPELDNDAVLQFVDEKGHCLATFSQALVAEILKDDGSLEIFAEDKPNKVRWYQITGTPAGDIMIEGAITNGSYREIRVLDADGALVASFADGQYKQVYEVTPDGRPLWKVTPTKRGH